MQSCNVLCPLCNRRKARRHCPALGQQICSVCCGTKRIVEIRCPPDCGYLSASRSHPPAVVQRQQQRDLATFAPTLQGLTEVQSRLLLLLGTFIARHVPQDFQTLRDEDIAEAAGTLAATLETAGRGVIYEHRAGTQPARHLADELKHRLDEIVRGNQGVGASGITDAAMVVLRRIEKSARETVTATEGSQTAYRDLLTRVLNFAPIEQPGPADAPTSGLIVP